MAMNSSVEAGDACAILMCMSGKLVGVNTGKSCAKPMADYFKIARLDRHSYSAGKTKECLSIVSRLCRSETSGGGKRTNKRLGRCVWVSDLEFLVSCPPMNTYARAPSFRVAQLR